MRRTAKPYAPSLPPLPDAMPSALGPIPVLVVARPNAEGMDAYGTYDTEQRTIEIAERMSLKVQWQILRHEWIHSVLFDAGVQLSKEQEEAVCTSIASALVAEMLTPL